MTETKSQSEVVLAPYRVTIRDDALACQAAGCTGQYMADEHTIMLDDTRPLSVYLDSLVHELLHACWDQAGLKKTVDDASEGSKGEQIIMALTPRIVGIIRDNEWLVDMIRGV